MFNNFKNVILTLFHYNIKQMLSNQKKFNSMILLEQVYAQWNGVFFATIVTSFLFENSTCRHSTLFGLFHQLYLQTHTAGNDVTAWVLEFLVSHLDTKHEWMMSASLDNSLSSIDNICWFPVKHQLPFKVDDRESMTNDWQDIYTVISNKIEII